MQEKVPSAFQEAFPDPSESIGLVRLRGEVNTHYAELRGELRTSLAETNGKIDRIDERLGSIRWGLALAVPVVIALTIVILSVVRIVFDL